MIDKKDWPALVAGLRNTLVEHGTAKTEAEEFNQPDVVKARRNRLEAELHRMDNLRLNLTMDDEDFWPEIAIKPFYARRHAGQINKYKPHMLEYHIGEWEPLCNDDWDWEKGRVKIDEKTVDICSLPSAKNGASYNKFIGDDNCYRSHRKLQKAIVAARCIKERKEIYPHRRIIDNFTEFKKDFAQTDRLMLAYKLGQAYLKLGQITTFHLMTDLGFQVVKPDSVLTRVAVNLGLIDGYTKKKGWTKIPAKITIKQALKLINDIDFCWALQARFQEIAAETSVSIRSLDFILVKLGQKPDDVSGIARTICDDNKPLCRLCGASSVCANAFTA